MTYKVGLIYSYHDNYLIVVSDENEVSEHSVTDVSFSNNSGYFNTEVAASRADIFVTDVFVGAF